MTKCPLCEYSNDSLISLSLHFRRKHKNTAKQLRIMLFHDGVEPTCKCGCGSPVKFHAIQMGFSEYVWGHAARVNNNWGHNEKAQKKSQDVRRKQIADGLWKSWNTGQTIETDERVAANAKAVSQSVLARPEERKKRSSNMRKNRLSGVIPTLYGKDHSQWKGGTSALQAITRSHLHSAWTYPKLKAANFTCQKCGANNVTLNVHHDKERFAPILQRAIAALGEVVDDSFAQKSLIAEWVTNYHIQNDVSGIVLCKACHDCAHGVS